MPELEVIRVLASITEVTDRGTKLLVKAFPFYCSVKSTHQSLQCLSSDVSLTFARNDERLQTEHVDKFDLSYYGGNG